ncbi:MAG: putative lipopolysaccharide heptosyltransferase III [Betaproteobacteria bacterium HGW-Betaproteobacteria-11]|nr:MAG: putative lipopolysaccharide heptosyltransferase III [Betaproteobacteria bacterium HGW-Betaproteobacteria-11]
MPSPASSPPFSPAALRRALVIKLRHHGDVLLAAPVLSTLRQFAPQCEIDALVYADTAPMLAGHPALAELHLIDRAWKRQGPLRQALAEARLLSCLTARRYDLVIHLSVHTRGAWLVRLLRPRWSVAPRYRPGFWENSFTHLYPAQSHPDRPTVDTNLDSLRALGLEPSRDEARVILVPGAAAEAKMAALLAAHGLSAGGFIHLHPTSRWLFKCWPAERVAALSRELAARGWPLVFTAAPEERERAMMAQILDELGRPGVSPTPTFFDFSGRFSLKELAALTAKARLFVGVDSAPMHIAAAMGTPTVAIFGPSGEREWGPWQVTQRIVTSTAHACRPCGRAGCNDSKISECLTTLPVAQVLAACDELLALPVAARSAAG